MKIEIEFTLETTFAQEVIKELEELIENELGIVDAKVKLMEEK